MSPLCQSNSIIALPASHYRHRITGIALPDQHEPAILVAMIRTVDGVAELIHHRAANAVELVAQRCGPAHGSQIKHLVDRRRRLLRPHLGEHPREQARLFRIETKQAMQRLGHAVRMAGEVELIDLDGGAAQADARAEPGLHRIPPLLAVAGELIERKLAGARGEILERAAAHEDEARVWPDAAEARRQTDGVHVRGFFHPMSAACLLYTSPSPR